MSRSVPGRARPAFALLAVASFSHAQVTVTENFTSTTFRDVLATGAAWGGGSLKPGIVGGNGVLGDFVASDGRFLGHVDGYDVWEWSTDAQTIPASRTLTGRAITVTNGVFQFASFIVNAGDRVVFRGSSPVRILTTGVVAIGGVVDVAAADQPDTFTGDPMIGSAQALPDAGRGQPGGAGGPGGSAGGQGANSLNRPVFARRIDGVDGGNVQLPVGHPYLARPNLTAGHGSLAWPPGANPALVCYSFSGVITLNCGSGGSGGSHWLQPASRGTVVLVQGNVQSPCDWGPDTAPGAMLFTPPVVPVMPSSFQFVLGGAGGGGGGTHPLDSILNQPIYWKAGAGGAGGAGALHLRAGLAAVSFPGAELRARGGRASRVPDQAPFAQRGRCTTGGGGSGGSVLIQSPQVFLTGLADLSGGAGGQMTLPYLNCMYRSLGGTGGPGYLRLEAIPQPPLTAAGVVLPPPTADNVGLLAEEDLVTGARSAFRTTGVPGPTFLRYEVDVQVGSTFATLSDDPTIGPPARAGFAPIALYLQGVTFGNNNVRVPGTETAWMTRAASLSNGSTNGFRFALLLDRGFFGPSVPLRVLAVRVVAQ